jgi:hypothetical protein
VIAHHQKELYEKREKLQKKARQASKPDAAALTKKITHLDLLMQYFESTQAHSISTFKSRLVGPNPTITFQSIWYALRPGSFAYCQFDNEWIGCVILRVKGKKQKNDPAIVKWNILVWFLLAPQKGKFLRGYTRSKGSEVNPTKHVIQHFEGERPVTSLPVIPREYWDARDNGARRQQFEARGKKKLELMEARPKEMKHSGTSIEHDKKEVRMALVWPIFYS